jgi:hypothetical protein
LENGHGNDNGSTEAVTTVLNGHYSPDGVASTSSLSSSSILQEGVPQLYGAPKMAAAFWSATRAKCMNGNGHGHGHGNGNGNGDNGSSAGVRASSSNFGSSEGSNSVKAKSKSAGSHSKAGGTPKKH